MGPQKVPRDLGKNTDKAMDRRSTIFWKLGLPDAGKLKAVFKSLRMGRYCLKIVRIRWPIRTYLR